MVKVAAREAAAEGRRRSKPFAEKRGALRREVRELRQQQRKVAALQKQADDALDEGANEHQGACLGRLRQGASRRLQDGARRAAARVGTGRSARHPVLAAFRGAANSRQVDLAPLDQDTDGAHGGGDRAVAPEADEHRQGAAR